MRAVAKFFLVRNLAQGCSRYPRHQVVQIPQMIQCLTPAKLVMGAAGILAQVGAGNTSVGEP